MDRAVKHLASYGRHGDDTLLHVSRAELAGIRQLTGKGFTTNPDTGLPEAFNWAGAILPAIAGIAATALTGGAAAPFVGAAASGLASAGVAKAQGKSTEQALTQGLLSGVTSYAGGQLLSGVGEVAGQAAGEAAGATANVAQQGLNEAAKQGVASTAEGALGSSANAGIQAAANATPTAGIGAVANSGLGAATDAGASQAANILQATSQPIAGQPLNPIPEPSTISSRLSGIGDRIGDVASDPGAAASRVWENVKAKPFSALTAGAGLYSSLTSPTGAGPGLPGTTPYDPNKYPERFPTNPRQWTPDPTGYTPGVSPERRYFAKGGIASMRGEEGMTANVVNEAKAALLNEHPRPKEALARFEGMFGSDALGMLRDRMTGGRITGAGGGMDDLIPGTIEGRQQVRLADGEFVIPSDVVSGLGDGSTDQGVRRLHEMMNSVRKQRTGKTAQPKSIGGKISL
jgi:hypothetical protein